MAGSGQWFDGVGSKTAEKVIADIEETGVFDVEPYRKRKYGGAFAYLAGVVEDAQPLTADLPALMEHLVEYYTPIMEQQYEDHRKRGRDLETLAVLAQRYDHRFDITAAQRHALAPQSLQVVQGLDRPVEVHAFFLPGVLEGQTLRVMLELLLLVQL